MKFTDSKLYSTIMAPVDYMEDNGLYHSLLRMPYFVLLYTVGIPMAIIIDFFKAMES